MLNQPARFCLVVLAVVAILAVGCSKKSTTVSTATTAPTTAATSVPVATATATAAPAATDTPAPAVVDPCTLRDSLEGLPLGAGVAFDLGGGVMWQLCGGGAAAGSSEKYLFKTTDGGVNWTLLSMTTLGNPTPEAGVGELPNGNGVDAMFFIDEQNGWLGLTSPGMNLFRTSDSGVTWTFVSVLDPGVPVTAINFTDASNGTFTTPDGDWMTSNGGDTWTAAP
jgi:hypothetical protein